MLNVIRELSRGGSLPTLVSIVGHRARQQPDRVVFRFLEDDERTENSITYKELDRRARSIAAMLQREGAAGQRTLLIYPPGLDYICAFLGCLYAGTIAVPAYPPDPFRIERTLPRLLSIIADSGARFGLTTGALLNLTAHVTQKTPALAALRWMASDLVNDLASSTEGESWSPPSCSAESLAFLQYTSGSTSSPKGVMVSHGNITSNLETIHEAQHLTPEDHSVLWLPLYHDMGLLNLLYPLVVGATHVGFSPLSFIRRPLRWLETISRYRATHSGGPNFAYELCLRKAKEASLGGLDLSCWRVAFNAAEPIRKETLDRFVETFAPHGFDRKALLPAYGLAEFTAGASSFPVRQSPPSLRLDRAALEAGSVRITEMPGPGSVDLVSCGAAATAHDIRIVDPESRGQLSDGKIGEIWATGPSRCQGYWGRPEESAHVFEAKIAGTEEGPFVRTGDLGFIHQGLLYVTGRLKDLIILHGRNHYPQDIELTVEQCNAAVRPGCVAAFPLETKGEERLGIAAEVDPRRLPADATQAGGGPAQAALRELASAIRTAVAKRHEVAVDRVLLLRTGTIPKTSSGKIQRRACRAEYQGGTLDILLDSPLQQARPDRSS